MKIKTQIFENLNSIPDINDIVTISEKNLHHLKNVLRLKNNDIIRIILNEEFEAYGQIVENKKSLDYKIIEMNKIPPNSTPNITICFAICKSAQNELIAEKLTELSIKNIYFWGSEHTSYKISELENKLERLEKIVEGAARQSKQNFIPKCKIFHSLNEMLSNITIKDTIILYCSLADNRQLIKNLALENKNIFILIGPEGDFSADEYNLLNKTTNAIPVTLGNYILKSETAAIVATSQVIGHLLQ